MLYIYIRYNIRKYDAILKLTMWNSIRFLPYLLPKLRSISETPSILQISDHDNYLGLHTHQKKIYLSKLNAIHNYRIYNILNFLNTPHYQYFWAGK